LCKRVTKRAFIALDMTQEDHWSLPTRVWMSCMHTSNLWWSLQRVFITMDASIWL
jgi:hypothetical protein